MYCAIENCITPIDCAPDSSLAEASSPCGVRFRFLEFPLTPLFDDCAMPALCLAQWPSDAPRASAFHGEILESTKAVFCRTEAKAEAAEEGFGTNVLPSHLINSEMGQNVSCTFSSTV
jgi:hypothetical protein